MNRKNYIAPHHPVVCSVHEIPFEHLVCPISLKYLTVTPQVDVVPYHSLVFIYQKTLIYISPKMMMMEAESDKTEKGK